MEKDTTAGLTSEQLARLLGVSCDPELGAEHDHLSETAGQVLDAYLAGASNVATAGFSQLPVGSGSRGGNRTSSLGEMLIDPMASEDTIAAIRQYAKRMAAQRASEAERAAATALYFAAIANGLVFHDRKLTTLSYDALQVSLGELLDKAWLSRQLVPLLEKARAICRARAI